MRYLPSMYPPANATTAQSTVATMTARIATARWNDTSVPRVTPPKTGMILAGPSSMKNTVTMNPNSLIRRAPSSVFAWIPSVRAVSGHC